MYKVDNSRCITCGACEFVCPEKAVKKTNESFSINEFCTDCGVCLKSCPVDAII